MSDGSSNNIDINVQALLKAHPSVEREIIDRYTPDNSLELLDTPSGHPTAKYGNRYIHSRHNPVREAERFINTEVLEEPDCCLFAGFGLGYQVEAFIEKYPSTPVFIVEPDIPFFLRALGCRDISGLLSHPYLGLFLEADPEALVPLFKTTHAEKIKLITLRSLYEKNEQYIKRLEQTVRSFVARNEINTNTLKRFGRLWVRNLITNLPLLALSRGIGELENRFKDMPALLLAAGPSLDDCVPYLPELAKRFIIIAVDTSAYACVIAGTSPDFLLVVDPQYWNTRHLDRCSNLDTVLISESSTHPRVFRELQSSPLFFCSSLFPLGTYLESRVEEKGKLGAGGSVSTSAWDFARLLGSRQIFCAGMDLGFPDHSTHYRGSFFEHRSHSFSYRKYPEEHFAFTYLYSADPYFIENNTGGKTLTDKRLIVYKWWFENQMKIHRDVESFSLSPHGIKIEGIPYKSLDSLLSFPIIRPEIDRIKGHVLNRGPQSAAQLQSDFTSASTGEKMERLHRAVTDLKTELASIRDLARDGIENTGRLERTPDNTTFNEILNELNDLDRKILSSVSKDIAGFLLHDISRTIIESGRQKLSAEEIYKNSESMYREIVSSAEYHLSLFESFETRTGPLSGVFRSTE